MILLCFIPLVPCMAAQQDSSAGYMALNGEEAGDSGKKHLALQLPENTGIRQIGIQDVLALDDGVVYVGAPWCPYCRNLMPVLTDVVSSIGTDVFYSLELDDEKSLWVLGDDGPECARRGSNAYYSLLSRLDPLLDEYCLQDGDASFSTGEKRIFMPSLILIRNGMPEKMWDLSQSGIFIGGDPYEAWSDIMKDLVARSLKDFLGEENKN